MRRALAWVLALAVLAAAGAGALAARLGAPGVGLAMVAMHVHYWSEDGVWRETNGYPGLQQERWEQRDASGALAHTWPADTRVARVPG